VIVRRLPMLGVVVASTIVVATAGRDTDPPAQATFSAVSATEPWMPSAPVVPTLSTTWHCPAVPASGAEGVSGEVLIANADPAELQATVTLFGVDGEPVVEDVTVAPRSRVAVDVGALITTEYAAAIVEITGGTGVVEQRARSPIGTESSATSVAACTTATSPNWYLAEGYTAEGSREQIVLTNPYSSAATVQVRFATQDGSREPTELQRAIVPPRSVRVLDMSELAARDEPEVAVAVEARQGELLVARVQTYAGSSRRGYAVTLAAPASRDQWWFADGEVAEGVSERYSIYNPGDDEVEVTAALLGIQSESFVPIDPIEVGAGQVVTFTPADVPGMPAGRHSMVFGTASLDARIVVERALTRTFDGLPTTSVVVGAVPRYEDGYVATTWTMGYGVEEPTEHALVVYNVDAQDAVVTVQSVAPEGIINVPGLEAVALAANGLISIDLTDDAAVGRQLIVRSTSRVFVERLLPRDVGALGRVGSWPLPAAG
jgi:hypothetical protein